MDSLFHDRVVRVTRDGKSTHFLVHKNYKRLHESLFEEINNMLKIGNSIGRLERRFSVFNTSLHCTDLISLVKEQEETNDLGSLVIFIATCIFKGASLRVTDIDTRREEMRAMDVKYLKDLFTRTTSIARDVCNIKGSKIDKYTAINRINEVILEVKALYPKFGASLIEEVKFDFSMMNSAYIVNFDIKDAFKKIFNGGYIVQSKCDAELSTSGFPANRILKDKRELVSVLINL